MIDLHLHTTASDGRSTPEALVAEAARAGIRTLAVTDHDTVAGLPAARAAASHAGLDLVSGIEITAVLDGRDVHMLGYFFDPDDPGLADFLVRQRADRRRRLEDIVDRLAGLGVPIDGPALFSGAARESGRAVGRPHVARALVAAGQVADVNEAFDRFLGDGRPAFVPRRGAPPAEVVALIAGAGGIASVAHPGKFGYDDMIPALARGGLQAIEAFHPDHSADDVSRYLAMADTLGLAVTGGSDYHGPGSGRSDGLGRVSLPSVHFERLAAMAAARRRS